MKTLIFSLILVASATNLSAQARTNCAPRQSVVERLAETYGETLQNIGITANGTGVVEHFANSETGTWTITRTDRAGVTCLVESGHDFEALTLAAPPNGVPA